MSLLNLHNKFIFMLNPRHVKGWAVVIKVDEGSIAAEDVSK